MVAILLFDLGVIGLVACLWNSPRPRAHLPTRSSDFTLCLCGDPWPCPLDVP